MVFDCDGVLIESNRVKTLAFGQTVSEFGQEAMDRMMAYHRENGGMSRWKKFEWFYREVACAPLSDEMMDRLCDRFTRLCLDAVLAAPMVPGAKESLNFLSGRLPMFVASVQPFTASVTVNVYVAGPVTSMLFVVSAVLHAYVSP